MLGLSFTNKLVTKRRNGPSTAFKFKLSNLLWLPNFEHCFWRNYLFLYDHSQIFLNQAVMWPLKEQCFFILLVALTASSIHVSASDCLRGTNGCQYDCDTEPGICCGPSSSQRHRCSSGPYYPTFFSKPQVHTEQEHGAVVTDAAQRPTTVGVILTACLRMGK
jgi:hypothetical protein